MNGRANTRIYVIASTNDGAERLLRAPSKARAVKDSVVARIASQDDLARLLARGVTVENDPTPSPPLTLTHRRRAP
jgi:hypothetical protein